MNQIRTAGARRRHMQAKRSHKMGMWVRSVIDQKAMKDEQARVKEQLRKYREAHDSDLNEFQKRYISTAMNPIPFPAPFSQVALDESLRREEAEHRKKRMAVVAAMSAQGPTESHDQTLYEQAKTAVEAMKNDYDWLYEKHVVRVTYEDPDVSPLKPPSSREESKLNRLSSVTNLFIVLMAILGGLLALTIKDIITNLFFR